MKTKKSEFTISIVGIGTELGSEVRTAEELGKRFSLTADDVTSKTGVTQLLFSKITLESLGFRAIKKIPQLDLSRVSGIFGSSNPTGTYLMPTPTAAIAAKLGLCPVIVDHIGLGCAGGLQALRNTYNQLAIDTLKNKISYYIVWAGDNTSLICEPGNEKTAFLFSEGAAALLVTNDPTVQMGYRIKTIDTKSLLGPKVYALSLENPYHFRGTPKIEMQGGSLFRFGVEILPDMLGLVGLKKLDKDMYLIPHQANLRMLDAMIRRFKLDSDHVYTEGISTIGNTSPSAVFFGLEDALRRKLIPTGCDKIILGAFGAELQVGAVLLEPLEHTDGFIPKEETKEEKEEKNSEDSQASESNQ